MLRRSRARPGGRDGWQDERRIGRAATDRRRRRRRGSGRTTSAATASASRVLPVPPGPVRVTSRTSCCARRAERGRHFASLARSGGSGGQGSAAQRGRSRVRCERWLTPAGRAAASRPRARAPEREGIGQQAHGLQPGSQAGAPLQVADAALAESRPLGQGLLRQRRGRCATGAAGHRTTLVVSLIAALPGSMRWLIRGVLWCAAPA